MEAKSSTQEGRHHTATKIKAKPSAPIQEYYAGGAYCRSPAPSSVPLPSNLMKASSPPPSPVLSNADTDVAPSPQRNESTEYLIGSILFSMVTSECGDMAGKVVGMLLELSDDEIAILLKDAEKRNEVVRDALGLLSEQSVLSSMASNPVQQIGYSVAMAC